MQVLHIRLGYFKVTLHVGIVFRARSSFKGIQTIYLYGFFLSVGIACMVDYSFKLIIPTLIFNSTNWNFGASL
jgi:hypothetical protein